MTTSTKSLLIWLSDLNSEVSTERIDAIEHPPVDIDDDKVVSAVIPLLHDLDDLVRLCAAETLGLYADPNGLEALRIFVSRERDPLARAYGLSSIGLIGETKDIKLLVDGSSRGQHPQVRVHAYRGLFDLVRRYAKEGLLSLVPHDEVQDVAVLTLSEVLLPRSDDDVLLALDFYAEREVNPVRRDELAALLERLRANV
ncbi:MAG: hypothetical protein H0X17_00430 [Deltaproteobacteria bacterium]|nr:hypothetical protein [Gemmatimonadaceae bacterium]MBA3817331.1 hypothetical protein [Deltaproteobacteria bacterium]